MILSEEEAWRPPPRFVSGACLTDVALRAGISPETLRKIREIYGLFSEEPILEGPRGEAGSEQGSEA